MQASRRERRHNLNYADIYIITSPLPPGEGQGEGAKKNTVEFPKYIHNKSSH
jgi:hypothetical protein